MVQSWLLNGVQTNSLLFNKLTGSKLTFKGQDQSYLQNNNKLKDLSNNISQTAEEEDDSAGGDNHGILSRLVRSTRDCVKKRERGWNKCLGEYITKVHCREKPLMCVPHNVPPKCVKKHELKFGTTGRACRIATTCVCV